MKVTTVDGASANQEPIAHLEWNSTLKLESTQFSTGTRNLQDENRDEEYATKDDKSAATDCYRLESVTQFERDMETFLNEEDATSPQGDAKGVSVPSATKAKQAYYALKKKKAAKKEAENSRYLKKLIDDDARSDDETIYPAIEFLYSLVDTLQDAVEELEESYDADHDPLTDGLNDLVDWYEAFDLMDAWKAINGNVYKAIFPNDNDGANPESSTQAIAGDQDFARSLNKEALVQEDLEDDVDIDEWLMEKKRETKEQFKNADAARKMAAKKQAKKKAEILVSKPAGMMRGKLGKTNLSIKKP